MPRSDSLRGAGTSAEVCVRQSPSFETTLTTVAPDFVVADLKSRYPSERQLNWEAGLLFVLDRQGTIQRRTVRSDRRAFVGKGLMLEGGLEPGDLILREQRDALFLKKSKTFIPADVTDRSPPTLPPWSTTK
jgi:hypothetical protein